MYTNQCPVFSLSYISLVENKNPVAGASKDRNTLPTQVVLQIPDFNNPEMEDRCSKQDCSTCLNRLIK